MNRIERQIAASRNVAADMNAFYRSGKFTESKRFQRFVDIAEEQIGNFLRTIQMHRTSGDDRLDTKLNAFTADKLFMFALADSVMQHTKEILECQDEEETDGGCSIPSDNNSSYGFLSLPSFPSAETISITVYSMMSSFAERHYSNLWALKMMQEDAGAEQESKELQPYLEGVEKVVSSFMFSMLYRDALERACFDYIRLEAVCQELEDETWLPKLKTLDERKMLYLMSKTLEYIIYSTEDYSAFSIIHNTDDSIPKALFEQAKFRTEAEKQAKKQEQQIAELTAELARTKEQLSDVTAERNELQKKVDGMESSREENIRLQREARKAKEAYSELSEKYESAIRFAEQLSMQKDEAAVQDTETETDDGLLRSKRIVFIRDKKNEGYAMMQRLAEHFPNARFTNCIASEINAKATDLIAVMTAYVCHGTYWSAESIARRKDIPIVYVMSKNANLIIGEVCKALSGQEGE